MMTLHNFKPLSFLVALAVCCQGVTAFGQADIAWTGSGDGSTFSDDNNWFATEAGGAGVAGPEFAFTTDSLKFDSAGATIDNDLDPATNGGAALQLGPGLGAEATSAAFHFLAGSGDFTIDGFGVTAGSAGNDGVFRADAGAGMLQTFNIPMTLTGGQKRRKVVLDNGGTVVFNGDINFTNSIMFADEGAGRIELNGNNTGVGPNQITDSGTNKSRTVFRNNVAGTVLALGSDTALGDANLGTWDAGDLQLRGVTAQNILTIESSSARDLSGYFVNIANSSGGGGVKIDNAADTSLGYLMRTGNGTRTFSATNVGKVTIEHGLFVSHNNQGRDIGLFSGGTIGNVEGGNGHIEINGRLHTSLIDPTSQVTNGTAATGGILPGLPTDAVPGNQFTGGDGLTLVNGSINSRFGKLTLNGDSSATWIGGQVVSSNFGIVMVGHDNAFGDSDSLVVLNNTGTVDIGTHTIEQRVVSNGGTLRGNGTLTNEADWSIAGAVQPGGEAPTAADTLTFDFANAAVGNTVTFEAGSTVEMVLDGGLASSSIDVFGPSLGGTTDVVFDGNTFSFTDLSGASLTEGAYTLFDGDANTSFTLGAGITVDTPTGYSGTLSILGDDVVLNLIEGDATGDADFNSDNDVDGSDFLTWQQNVDTTLPVPDLQPFGDANSDGFVDGLDLVIWQAQYGTSGGALAATSAVPEPGTIMLLLVGLTAGVATRRVR